MKRLYLILVLMAAEATAPALVADATASGDVAWTELQALKLFESKVPDNYTAMTMREKHVWYENRAQLLREKGLAFYETFPADSRRWEVAWQLLVTPPQFIQAYGPNADRDYQDVVIDEPAAAAWKTRLARLAAAMDAAPDLSAQQRENLDYRKLRQAVSPITTALRSGQSADLDQFTALVFAFGENYPASGKPAELMRGIMYGYEPSHRPAESAALWSRFVDTVNTGLADMAKGKVAAFDAISRPLDLAFTAVDGREVDLKKLRGKVVLIDFWATWCVPCLEEMPNVKKVYASYHYLGFEIVGISCDFLPEQAGKYKASAGRTGEQVAAFCRENDMPWPEYYDGRKHNEGGNLLAKRFAITGIPASFLVDQEGNVVALNLRGEALEREVRRLLPR